MFQDAFTIMDKIRYIVSTNNFISSLDPVKEVIEIVIITVYKIDKPVIDKNSVRNC